MPLLEKRKVLERSPGKIANPADHAGFRRWLRRPNSRRGLKLAPLVAVIALGSSSCASVLYGPGPQQIISVTTEPPGATVQVGGQRVVSPAQVSIDRYQSTEVIATKPGYEPSVAYVESEYNWATLVDLGLVLPWVVDVMTNSVYSLSPDIVNLVLTPVQVTQTPPGSRESEALRRTVPNS